MCIRNPATEDDLTTVHHERGHDYYFHAYYKLPLLYQAGANDGFHEAIGDSLVLSMTPGYLKQLACSGGTERRESGDHVQMKNALAKVAFLPLEADR